MDGDREVTPSGDRQRRLLAALVAARGSVVSGDRLVELLWGDRLPADHVAALQTHVFRLRRVLPEGAIETAPTGYRLVADAGDVDAECFSALVAEAIAAKATSSARALALLDDALSLWRGEPYEELAEMDAGRIEAARLRETEVVAREERLATMASINPDHHDLLAELVAFAARHPLRERPCELLMVALHEQGRAAEASRAYDDFRRRLADDLGLGPSPELQSLHERILSGTPRRTGATEGTARAGSPIPAAPNPLLGRDELVAKVLERVARARLVTLIGPGGVGKTRVAGEVARRVEATGTVVWFCELGPADASNVELFVAEELRVEARAGTPLRRRITDALATESGMLVLDGCDHVIDAASALVDEIMRRCPAVAVLVSSRERLAVDGEHLAPVAPFAIAAEPTEHDPAIQLFTARASAVAPDFVLTDETLPAIVDVCRRLDGLPLAIELAAARLQAMSLAEVTAGIDERFALLTSGSRTAPRQRSLAAAISWSYDLLDASSQRAFDTLGVFSGPFPQRGAAAVGDVTIGELVALVERSLVQRGADGRFVLLESLRAFAADRLVESGRVSDVRRRHATWVLDEAIEAERALDRDARSAFAELDALLPEIRAAHRFMLEIGDADGDVRLVRALNSYAFFRMRPELLAWGEEAAVLGRAAGHPGTPSVLAAAGLAAWKRGDLDELRAHADDALATAGALGLPIGLDVANVIGVHGLVTGDLDDAERWFAAALSASDAPDNPVQRMVTATDRVLAAAYAKSDRAAALTEALIAAIPDHPTPHGAYAWHGAAEAVMDDDPEEARTRAQRSLDEAEVTGAWFVTGVAGTLAASIDARRGDFMRAITAYRWLLPWWRKAGEWSVLGTLLRSMAELLHQVGRNRSAAVLLAAVLTPGAGHEVFGDDARRLADLARRLEPELGDEFHVATAEGSALTVEEAATLAEAELDAI
ncbi:MAG TPA: BTAD domain-containing putative transcriptional regulator [Acidimicrobiales bacterium]|nr:BTAD domain-containing putative transcriptional regulator [Acidimicrobiales bacterium]